MKNILFIITICLLTSCKDFGWMEPKEQTETNVLQTIKGANDCVISTVSWQNGEATADGWNNESFFI